MAGLESLSVGQIRQMLVDKYGYSVEQAEAIKGKTNLAIEIQQAKYHIHEDGEDNGEFFSTLEVENNEIEDKFEPAVCDPIIPKIGSPDWQTYVLAHLLPGEYFEKDGNRYPKCAGLRRVSQVLLGEIVESGPTQIFAPQDTNEAMNLGRATVVYEVKIAWKNSPISYIDLSDLAVADCEIRTFREAADAWAGNTPHPFSSHLIATASTRAEGRAFKKALMLNIHTAEEMLNKDDAKEVVEKLIESDGEFKDNAPINGSQVKNITRLSKRLDIDVSKLIFMSYPDKTIDSLTTGEASNICATLNKYQSKGRDSLVIPDAIKVVNEIKE